MHGDDRGFFVETFRRNVFADLGMDDELVQDNHSRSSRGIVRGMHYQVGMAKLVRSARGTIFDVLVDIRRDSDTFGQWEGFELSDSNHRQLYCPEGFAHGFCVVSEIADVVYKCSSYYDPELEGGFAFDDPDVAIEWPQGLELLASARDRSAPLLKEIEASLPFAHSSAGQ